MGYIETQPDRQRASIVDRIRELWHRVSGADDRPIPYTIAGAHFDDALSTTEVRALLERHPYPPAFPGARVPRR